MADELGYHQMTAAAKRERNKGGLRNIGVIISEKYLAAYTTFYWKMYQELQWLLLIRTVWQQWKS